MEEYQPDKTEQNSYRTQKPLDVEELIRSLEALKPTLDALERARFVSPELWHLQFTI